MEDKTMKKVFGIAALLLALAACNKIETESQVADKTGGIPFSATVSLANNAATRALAESGSTITATWAEGETVALIHNGVSDEMTVSSVSGGSATISGTITGTPADGDAVTIIYPSSAADGTTGNIKANLLYAQNGLLTGTGSISESFDVRKGEGTLKVNGTATLSGGVSLTNQFAIFKFTVKNHDGSAAISAKPLTITIGTQDYVITPASATDVLYAALPAVSEEKVSFDATDGSDRTYTYAKHCASFEAGKYYQSTLKMREYVDLGIVVGGKIIKWATCNVGASKPEDYGDYFAWGETSGYNSGKTNFSWTTYFDTSDGGTTFTKYATDKKTVLDFEDDAARASWGGSWRMPTDEEWTWLLENCTWTWTDNYNGAGVAGRIVTSNVSGYKGNTIFLPAAGYRYHTSLRSAGSFGYYCSSSLRGGLSDAAWGVRFYSEEVYRYGYNRFYGFSVRPVSE